MKDFGEWVNDLSGSIEDASEIKEEKVVDNITPREIVSSAARILSENTKGYIAKDVKIKNNTFIPGAINFIVPQRSEEQIIKDWKLEFLISKLSSCMFVHWVRGLTGIQYSTIAHYEPFIKTKEHLINFLTSEGWL